MDRVDIMFECPSLDIASFSTSLTSHSLQLGWSPLSQVLLYNLLTYQNKSYTSGWHKNVSITKMTNLTQEQARGVIKGYKVLLEKTDFDLLGKNSELFSFVLCVKGFSDFEWLLYLEVGQEVQSGSCFSSVFRK